MLSTRAAAATVRSFMVRFPLATISGSARYWRADLLRSEYHGSPLYKAQSLPRYGSGGVGRGVLRHCTSIATSVGSTSSAISVSRSVWISRSRDVGGVAARAVARYAANFSEQR